MQLVHRNSERGRFANEPFLKCFPPLMSVCHQNGESVERKNGDLWQRWLQLQHDCTRVEELESGNTSSSSAFSFHFVEGSLITAVREGHWLLLDEINLASMETLERLSSLLDGEEVCAKCMQDVPFVVLTRSISVQGTICITEKGETESVIRHANFRIFACMNPSTDVGKKDLPPALKNRFTEFYVEVLVHYSLLLWFRMFNIHFLTGIVDQGRPRNRRGVVLEQRWDSETNGTDRTAVLGGSSIG